MRCWPRHLRYAAALAAFITVVAAPVRAQSLEMFGGGTVTVGDPVTLGVRAVLPPGAVPLEAVPHARDSLPESVRLLGADTLRRTHGDTLVGRLRLAFYRTGSLSAPAFVLAYRAAGRETPDSVTSGSVLVTVVPTLPDTAVAMRDIRALALPAGSEERVPWALVIAALLVAAVVAIWARARRRARSPAARIVVAGDEPVDPLAAVLARLDAIERERWPERGDVARQYDEVSDVLRRYLEEVHGVAAERRTTSEIVSALPPALAAADGAARTRAVLAEADLVKFARLRPGVPPAQEFLERARALVRAWEEAGHEPAAMSSDAVR